MPGVPSTDEVTEQATSNAGDAAVGVAGLTVASAVMGPTIGPAVGGTIAGASVGGTTGDVITLMGMMQSGQNIFGGAPRASDGGGSGGTRL